MKPALATVKANNDYSTAELDLSDAKLQTALNIINGQGKNLAHNLQVTILSQFRGNPSALAVLEGAMKSHGLYFSGLAHEMQKPISSEALENMTTALAFYDYGVMSKGIYDFDEKRIYWTQNAFKEQAQRLGYDEDGTEDAYTYAIAELQRQTEEELFSSDQEDSIKASARKMTLDSIQADVARAKQNGEDVAAAFDRAIKRTNNVFDLYKPSAEPQE